MVILLVNVDNTKAKREVLLSLLRSRFQEFRSFPLKVGRNFSGTKSVVENRSVDEGKKAQGEEEERKK